MPNLVTRILLFVSSYAPLLVILWVRDAFGSPKLSGILLGAAVISVIALFGYETAPKMGHGDRDLRRDVYEQVPGLQMADLRSFFDEYIKDKRYTILVLET